LVDAHEIQLQLRGRRDTNSSTSFDPPRHREAFDDELAQLQRRFPDKE